MPGATPAPFPPPAGDRAVVTLVVLIVLAAFGIALWHATPRLVTPGPEDFYGHLTDAFLAGQTHLKVEPHPALKELANPYAGHQGIPRLHDASYYGGRYYLYFGVPPVLLLLGPWRVLTGTYLDEAAATTVFGAAGFLLGAWLLVQVRRWHFPRAGRGWLVLALSVWGLGSYAQSLAYIGSVYPVPIAGAFACVMAAFAAGARALREPTGWKWPLIAGLAWGTAVACRPNYLFTLPAAALGLACLFWASQRQQSWRRALRGAIAFVAAIVVIGALLAAYNWARFGSITEFGTTYMFAAQDQREMAMTSWRNLPGGLRNLLLGLAGYGPYFPFIAPRDGVWSLAVFCPLALLAFAWPWRLWRDPPTRSPLALAALVPLLAALGVLLTLAMLPTQNDRYLVDFLPGLLLVALFVLLAQADESQARVGRFPRLRRAVLVGAAMWTLAHAVGLNFWLLELQGQGDRLARLLNRPAAAVEKALDLQPGPVRLRVILPAGELYSIWPLFVSGDGRDLIYVRYAALDQVEFGYHHRGAGGPKSPPIPIEVAREYEIEIDAGALYPPKSHPAWDDIAPAERDALRRRLRIKVSGQVVLDTATAFYPTHPFELQFGRNPSGYLTGRKSLHVRSVERLGLAAGLQEIPRLALAPVRLQVTFPEFSSHKSEPLVATGHRNAGDTVYVSYIGVNQLRFGHDSWGGGAWESAALPYEPGKTYAIEMNLGSLQPRAKGPPELGPLHLRYDNELVVAMMRPFHPSEPAELTLGFNAAASSVVSGIFTGRIVAAENIAKVELPVDHFAPGPIRLSVRFPKYRPGRSEPLLTSGVTGAGDFVYVTYVDDRTIRLGYDHWNVGGPQSDPIPIDYGATHAIEISTGALYPADPSDPLWGQVPPEMRKAARSQVTIKLNGKVVLEHRSDPYPARPEEITVGRNDIGGSTAEPVFSGEIFSRESLPLERTLRRR